ncbi:MAG: hypothetical protein M1296_03335 [Chloroflexi bacterium]|nr:hypothetical protein [Chloroflexota bacterium]
MKACDLTAGQRLTLDSLKIPSSDIERYNEVTSAPRIVIDGLELVPPTLLVAQAFRRLMEMVELPDGTIHLGQDIEVLCPVGVDRWVDIEAVVNRASIRQGQLFLFIELWLRVQGVPTVRAVTSVVAPGAASS